MTTGVCIHSSSDLAEAKGIARRTRKVGAEVMVLDQNDAVLADSRQRAKGRPTNLTQPPVESRPTQPPVESRPTQPPAESRPTQPPVEPTPREVIPTPDTGSALEIVAEKEARPAPSYSPPSSIGGIAPSDVDSPSGDILESNAASAYMAPEDAGEAAPKPAEPGHAMTTTPVPIFGPPPDAEPAGREPRDSSPAPRPQPRQAEEPARTPPPAAEAPQEGLSGSFNLDDLQVDELISLDGGLKRSGKGEAEGPATAQFKSPYKPDEDEELQLDHKPLPGQDEFADAPSGSDLLPEEAFEDDPSFPGGLDPKDVFPEEPSSAGARRGPGSKPAARRPTGSAPRPQSPLSAATSEAASRAADIAADGAGAVMDGAQGVVARLQDLFEGRQRIRLLLGFAVAVGVGGIFPVYHANSSFNTFFHPIMQELSNAKAHEKRGDELSEERKPAAVQKVLGSLKMRYFAFTACLWLPMPGYLAFNWFRIT